MKTLMLCCLFWAAMGGAQAQSAWQFDGIDDYAQVADYPALQWGTQPFTLEVSISDPDFSAGQPLTLLHKFNPLSYQGFRWSITATGIEFQLANEVSTVAYTFGAGCTHLAISREKENLFFYANGNLIATKTLSAVHPTNSSEPLLIGISAANAYPYKGGMDELRLWATRRTTADLNTYKNNCLPRSQQTAPLVGYWNIDENNGQFGNNLGSFPHYARLGNSNNPDTQDPLWTNSSCVVAPCCAVVAEFVTDNVSVGFPTILYNQTAQTADSIWWIINGTDTISSTTSGMDSLVYTFNADTNIVQLIVFGSGCNGVQTKQMLMAPMPMFNCNNSPLDPCQLVCNGTFDEDPVINNILTSFPREGYYADFREIHLGYGAVPSTTAMSQSFECPDLFAQTVIYNQFLPDFYLCGMNNAEFPNPISTNTLVHNNPNGNFASIGRHRVFGFMQSGTERMLLPQGIHFPLHTPLQPGIVYEISMRVATGCAPADIFVVLCTEAPTQNGINDVSTTGYGAADMIAVDPSLVLQLPSGTGNVVNIGAKEIVIIPANTYTASTNYTNQGLTWNTVTFNFTVNTPLSITNQGLDNIIVGLRPQLDPAIPNTERRVYYFDDIRIRPTEMEFEMEAEDIIVCQGQTNVNIPLTLTSSIPATVVVTANLPGGGIVSNTYTVSAGSNVVNFTAAIPAATGNYSITFTSNVNANSPCIQNPAPQTEVVNVSVQPNLTPTLNAAIININPVTRTVMVWYQVCAPGNAPGTLSYTLNTPTPNGWVAIPPPNQPITIRTFNLAPGTCTTWFIHRYQLPADACICGVDFKICAKVLGGNCIATVEKCLEVLPTQLGFPATTVVPATVPDFTTAISAGYLSTGATLAQNVTFCGDIIQNAVPAYTFNNSQIRMAPGVQIIVPNGRGLVLNNAHVRAACSQLWRSLTIEPGGTLTTTNNTIIEDGLYAVQARGKAALSISQTTFRRNYVGIYIPPIGFSQPMNSVFFSAFLNNTFTGPTSAPFLLPAYPNAPATIQQNRAYAGMLMYDQAAFNVNTTTGAIATFSNMANGIVAFRTNITVEKDDLRFTNMTSQFYPNTAALPSGNGIVNNGNFGSHFTRFVGLGGDANSPVSFTNCVVGINSINADLYVYTTRMTAVNAGVQAAASTNRKIDISGNRIQSPLLGIHLWMNGTTASTIINNNHITANGGLGNFAIAGIDVNNGGATDPNLRINNNTINQQKAAFGIRLQAQSGGSIYENTINLSSGTGNTPARRGITILNSPNLQVSCNSVSITQGSPNNTWGLFVSNSGDCVHSCNQFHFTQIGAEFDGNCIGFFTTRFRGNYFNNHAIGLRYSANSTRTGDQNDAGNRWAGTYSQWGAQHLSPSYWSDSEYRVNPSINPQFAPPSVSPALGSNWFLTSSNTGGFTCTGSNACSANPLPAFAPVLRAIDTTIATNTNPQNSQAEWALRRMLYEKLDKNPQWRNGVFAQFYNQQQTAPLSNVYVVDTQRQTTGYVDTTDILALEIYRQQIESLEDSIALLDSLHLANNNPNHSNQRDALIQQLEAVNQNAVAYNQSLHNYRLQTSQTALADNSGILSNFAVEQNEKLFNEIYLQTAAIGNMAFTPAQKQQLETLIYQCPAQGGNVIFNARALYQIIEPTAFFDLNCSGQQARMSSPQDSIVCYDTIHFVNPSLEGTPGSDRVPPGWSICENSPNTFPYGLYNFPPSDGNTYVNIVYGSGTPKFIESFGQFLEDTLETGKNYRFSVDVVAGLFVNALDSQKASIWIGKKTGNYQCIKEQLLYRLAPPDSVWQTNVVAFTAFADYDYIIITVDTLVQSPLGYAIDIDNFRSLPSPCDTFVSNTNVITPQVAAANDLRIYPNPNSMGVLNVEWQNASPQLLSQNEGLSIVVVDALGREVGNYAVPAGITAQQIDIAQLASGYYTVLLQHQKRAIARAKLVVAK